MATFTQLSVFLENRPGTLAAVLHALAARDVNVLGISVAAGIDHAVVRMVVDDDRKAIHVLGEAGVLVVESEVIGVPLKHQPGALAKLARKLADAKLNIEYAYGTSARSAKSAYLFVHVDDPKKAKRVLGRS
jgi:hypothetical protein